MVRVEPFDRGTVCALMTIKVRCLCLPGVYTNDAARQSATGLTLLFCVFCGLFVCMFACLLVRLSVCLIVCLSVCVLVCLFVCLFVCLLVHVHLTRTIARCTCSCVAHVSYFCRFACFCVINVFMTEVCFIAAPFQ